MMKRIHYILIILANVVVAILVFSGDGEENALNPPPDEHPRVRCMR